MLPSLKARHQQFIRERQYLHNVSPATVRWYTHAFKWLSLCASPEDPSQDELNAAVCRMRERGLSGTARLSGDIKHHGHVAAAGSLHKSGNFYRCINDAPFTLLPEFWQDYKHTKKAKPAPLTPFEADCLRKDDLLRNPDTSPLGLARKRAYDYEVRLRERLAAGEVVIVKAWRIDPEGTQVELSDPTGEQGEN